MKSFIDVVIFREDLSTTLHIDTDTDFIWATSQWDTCALKCTWLGLSQESLHSFDVSVDFSSQRDFFMFKQDIWSFVNTSSLVLVLEMSNAWTFIAPAALATQTSHAKTTKEELQQCPICTFFIYFSFLDVFFFTELVHFYKLWTTVKCFNFFFFFYILANTEWQLLKHIDTVVKSTFV